MSDFDIPSNSISDGNDIANLSDVEGYDDDYNNDDHDDQEDKEIDIDMDEEPIKYSNKIAMSLSDKFCVDRHKKNFLDLVKNKLDITFANEQEIMSLIEEFEENTNEH